VSTSRVLFEVEGPLAFLTINRPEAHNAMTFEMYGALFDACDRVDADGSIRVFVLRGAGGRAFVSGSDIAQFTAFTTAGDALAYERRIDAVIDRVERVRAATIAVVSGVATGAGCVLALACDLRVCTRAARFGIPISRTLGNCLSAANYARLLDLVGPARLKDLLITARLLEVEEATALGWVSRLADADDLDRAVRDLAETVAARAPLTIWATKELVRRTQAARRLPQAEADDVIAACYGSSDFREGVQAFLAKRTPRFEGR
jgi:enoyl-CoA hydratase/carnithine racemase